MSFETACMFCGCPPDSEDCTKRGEGVGFTEPLGCCDPRGVFDDFAGVDDRDFRDELPRFREEVGDDIVDWKIVMYSKREE